MRIFQFLFNPKQKEDLIFDNFCYEPENIYEKRLGSLYTIGVLKNALPQNQNFLEKISKYLKERYYQKTLFKPERALRETLKETNDFLAQIVKEGDVSWLGNLSFAILNIKNFALNFTKVGEIKIYLIRGKKIIDIDKRLRLQDIEPYPLKIFGNIVSGKLIEDDLILVLTKEVFEFFQNENLVQKLRDLAFFDEKEFKKILDEKKEALSQVKGIAFVISLTKETAKGKKEIIAPKVLKEFSLKEFFSTVFYSFLKIEPKKLKPFSFSEIFSPLKEKILTLFKNPKFLLILTFILILILGYFLFQ
jgi:hypothetical protein